MGFLLPFLVALIPLLITPGLLFHYDSLPKVALLVLIVALALLRPNRIARDVDVLWRTRAGKQLCVLAIAQVMWSGVATLTSSRLLFSLLGSNWRRFGLLTIVALAAFSVLAASQLVRRPRFIIHVLRATAIAAIGISLYATAQYFNIDPLQNGAGYHAQDGDFTIVRPPSTMGHADYLGWWLAIAVFCSWGLSRVERTAWRRVALTATSLSAIATVLSGTRSAIAAIGFGLLYLTATSPVRVQRKRILSVAAVVAAFAVFYLSPGGEHLRARVRWSSDEVPGGARPLLWRDSLRMAAVHPLTGFGPETFAAEFPLYQSVDLARVVPGFYHESPHNVALDALTSEGIPGLLIAAAWLGLGFRFISGIKEKAPIDRALAAAFVASCAASFFNVMTIGPAVSMLTLLAILLARSVTDDTGLRKPDISPAPKAITFAVSLPIAAVLAGFGVLLLASDFKLERFSRIAGGHDSVLAVDSYQRLRGTALAGPSEDLYCSRKLAGICGSGTGVIARLQCSLIATQAAVRAISTADNPPNAWYNLAMFTAAHNDGRGTEKALRTASELAPNWFRPHWALAKFLDLSGRKDEASTEIRRAALLGAGKEQDVTDSLRTIAQAR
jgi:O-antigen ligase